jgi:ubiquinone/menaquinone biosynthesis C-methylase UbiE
LSTNATAADNSEYPLSGDATARDVFNLRTVHRDAAYVVTHLRPGMRLVDFGCGAGSLTCGFAELVAPAEVLGYDISDDAIARARSMAARSGLSNVQFSVANINDLDLPTASFDVAHFNGVLMYLRAPERALQLAFRSLKSGGLLAAHEAQKGGDWFAGPYAESIALYFTVILASARVGDLSLGKHLPRLVRQAGFVRLEATPSYSAVLSNVKDAAAMMLSGLGRPDFRAAALEYGLSVEQFDRFRDEISSWAESEDSMAAFAGCNVIGWKP